MLYNKRFIVREAKVGLLKNIFEQHFQCYKTFLILSKNMIFQ